ncbi:MAG: ABC transporter permease [Cryomorphaceae bacterium]|nr:MAG: ABC transporter permease [Cryomorphaceae bacterium]
MNKIGLIISREYSTRVKKKSFLLMTLLGPLLIAGLMIGAIYLGLSDDTQHMVLVVDETPVLDNNMRVFEGRFKESPTIRFEYASQIMSDEDFKESPFTLMLILNEEVVTNPVAELVSKKQPSLRVKSNISKQVERIIEQEKVREHGLSYDTYKSISTSLDLIDVDVTNMTRASRKQEKAIVGFAFAVVIYFFIFLYGVQVMRGVIEEKTNRIVEVIISSVKPFELMMGKIIGIALVGLTQFMLWIVLTGVLTTVAQAVFLPDMGEQAAMAQMQMTQDVASEVGKATGQEAMNKYFELFFYEINWFVMLGSFLFFFLAGYLLYAALFAAVGAAVDSEADTQQFMLPITIPLVFGFIVAEMSLANPEGTATTIFSLVPLTSPVVMMVRVAMGVPVMEAVLSMLLLVGGFLLATWVAGKIYRTGILMYGKKVNYRELWKWIRFQH